MNYLRRAASGAAGNDLGTTAKFLRRTTSGAVGNGLSRYRGLLMSPFATSAPKSTYFTRVFVANKYNSTAEARGLGSECVCVGSELARSAYYKKNALFKKNSLLWLVRAPLNKAGPISRASQVKLSLSP